jgi:enolase-phosphatase E1
MPPDQATTRANEQANIRDNANIGAHQGEIEMSQFQTIQHLLLDIEGTTCPVSFVSEVLFPYASEQLLPYLRQHQAKEPIRALLAEVQAAWQNDNSPEAIDLANSLASHQKNRQSTKQAELTPEDACVYLQWLIRQDRKLTALKELQGFIWEEGYQKNELIAPLFPDVPPALQDWHQKGMGLAVYSSGSVQAQKLLYSHTDAGDLSQLFTHWFDTRIGAKDQPESYEQIAILLEIKPQNILFISDTPRELAAARNAQMMTTFSCRPGNPHQQAEGYPKIETFAALAL